MPTVLIADHSRAFLDRTRAGLEQRGFTVVATTANVGEAVDLAIRVQPDVCLVELGPDGNGLTIVGQLAKALPRASVVALAESTNQADVIAVFKRGASGYLSKDIGADELAASVRAAVRGEPALSRALIPLLVSQVRAGDSRQLVLPSGPVVLTAREWEVGELLQSGLPTADIADRLGLSPVTVRRHVGLLMKKLGVDDRSAAIETLRQFSR